MANKSNKENKAINGSNEKRNRRTIHKQTNLFKKAKLTANRKSHVFNYKTVKCGEVKECKLDYKALINECRDSKASLNVKSMLNNGNRTSNKREHICVIIHNLERVIKPKYVIPKMITIKKDYIDLIIDELYSNVNN